MGVLAARPFFQNEVLESALIVPVSKDACSALTPLSKPNGIFIFIDPNLRLIVIYYIFISTA